MSVFKLPIWVIQKIDKIRRSFLWHGVSANSQRLSLANWNIVCTPKKLGGLGITNMVTFNQAMLAKWVWQWLKPNDKLWKSIFNINSNFEGLMPTSGFFQSTLKHIQYFCDISIRRVVGNGESIRFWFEDWGLGILRYRYPDLFSFAYDHHITIASAMQMGTMQDLFRNNLSNTAIIQLRLLQTALNHLALQLTEEQDDAKWKWSSQGEFSVKSAYYNMKNSPRQNEQDMETHGASKNEGLWLVIKSQ